MTIPDSPRPAWQTELGLRVASDHDLAAPEPRFSDFNHAEIWNAAAWAAVVADTQENVRMAEGEQVFAPWDTIMDNFGYAEHMLDNLDEMAAETAWTWEQVRVTGDYWSPVDDMYRHQASDEADGS